MALVFVGGSFYTCAMANPDNRPGAAQAQAQKESVVVEVDGVPVTSKEVQDIVDQQTKQYAQFGGLPAEQEPMMVAGALNQVIQQAAIRSLTQKSGLTLTDEQVRAKFTEQIDQAVKQVREQMLGQKMIKPDATQADVDKAFKAQSGRSLTEAIQQAKDQFEKGLKEDPEKTRAPILLQAYLEQQAKANPASEAELKANYDTYTVKQILLKGPDAKAQAEKIEGELKGGLKFEDAMNRYSKDMPLPNKKVAENTLTLTAAQFETPQYTSLKGLKAGEVSPPSENFEGTAIYKIIGVKQELPKDFDKNKAKLAEDLAKQRVAKEVQTKAEAIAKGEGIVWKNDVYKALASLNPAPGEDAKAQEAKLRTAADAAKAASAKASGDELRLAGLLRYAALSQLASAPGTDKAALRKDQIAAIQDVLKAREDAGFRMNLVNLLTEDKSPEAGDALLEAARYNNDTTPKGQSQYASMAAKLAELKTAKLITTEQAAQVQTELSRWLKEKADFEKAEAATRATQPKPGAGAPGMMPPGGAPVPPAGGAPR